MSSIMQDLFGLAEEEKQLRDSAEEFLRKNKLDDDSPWRQLADLGWVGACVPSAMGGYAETGREALIISECFGAHGVTVPLMAATYAPSRLLCADPDVLQRHRALINEVALGKERIVIAWSELGRPFERVPDRVVAEQTGGRWELSGRKIAVLGGAAAKRAIVSARANGGTALFMLALDQEGVETQAYSILGGFRSTDLTFHKVVLPPEALIAIGEKADFLLGVGLDSAACAACADMVGAVEKALHITEDYTRTRKQFGQAIASFQVIQHRLVDVAIDLEYSRSCEAIVMNSDFIRRGTSYSPAAIAGARSEIMRRAQHAVADAVQLHGGIGMTEEAPIGHYFKRVAALANVYGNADWQLHYYHLNRSDTVDLLKL